jgi:DNA polymerase-1
MTTALPNVRKLFVPDPGYAIFDADLSGADAQVVAAEASDDELLAAFAAGLDVHSKNAADLFGTRFTSLTGAARTRFRQQSKQAVHGTNYGASARALSLILGWSLREATDFQRNWFALHPGIQQWQERTLNNLRAARNAFGYRIIYFDRVDGLLPQALAWIPQSTVAINTRRGAISLERACPWAEILLQVHDSVVFQVPFRYAERYDAIKRGLRNPIPYDPPLTIEWKLSRSLVSWGDCEEVKLAAAA